MGLFDLRRELVFYGSYHSNLANIIIHGITVPLLALSFSTMLAYTPQLVPYPLRTVLDGILPAELVQYLKLDAAFCLVALYSSIYLVMEPFAGLTWSLLQGLPIWLGGEWARENVPDAWQVALAGQLVCWWAQVHLGHIVYEKRRPALLDSLLQAFLTAPLFVWMEVLFAIGYRRSFAASVRADIDAAIEQHRAAERGGSAIREPLTSTATTSGKQKE